MDKEAEIHNLHELREQGILNETEYNNALKRLQPRGTSFFFVKRQIVGQLRFLNNAFIESRKTHRGKLV